MLRATASLFLAALIAAPAWVCAQQPNASSLDSLPQFDLEGTLLPNDPDLDVGRIQFDGEPRAMSLREVVMLAIDRNLTLRVEGIDAEIAEEDVTAAKSIYDPVARARFAYTETERETNSTAAGGVMGGASDDPDDAFVIEQESLGGFAEIRQLLPTGGSVYAGVQDDRTDIKDARSDGGTISPAATERAYIGFSQPLLKDLGWPFTNVTDQEILVRRKQEEIAEAFLFQEVNDQLAAVVQAYWEIVFAIQNLEVQRASLASALELLRVNQVRVEAGTAPRVDLFQSQAQVAERRNRVIDAKSQILGAQDRLLRLLNWLREDGGNWDNPILPTDEPFSFDLEQAFSDDDLIPNALVNRPDYEAALLNVDIAGINLDVASWQRLPELNLFAEYGANGLDDDRVGAFDDVAELTYDDYQVGLEFRYPIFNRRAKAQYRASELRLERNQIQVEQMELGITTEVRAATRAVRTAQASIEASIAQVRAAQESLQAEQKRLEVGTSTTFQVLEFQEDLAQARVNLARALVNYHVGLAELYRSQGTILEWLGPQFGIEFAYLDILPPVAFQNEKGDRAEAVE